MEYLDGGAEMVEYWWGYAINLNAQECKNILPVMNYGIGVTAFAAAISGRVKGRWAVKFNIACVVLGMNLTTARTLLEIGGNGNGATLIKNPFGYYVKPY